VIYGKWLVQASKQANIHTHGCNEVTLVWGSLRRLAPKILFSTYSCSLWLSRTPFYHTEQYAVL